MHILFRGLDLGLASCEIRGELVRYHLVQGLAVCHAALEHLVMECLRCVH